MNTPIDPLRVVVGATPRHTEATDTRLGIHHHDEQQHKRKEKDDKEGLNLPEDVYDQTTLGVQALIDFLRNFLRTMDPPVTIQPSPDAADTVLSSPPPGPDIPPAEVNAVAARAASAYGHAASTTHALPGYQQGGHTTPADPALLQSAEARQVHALLDKLEQLNKRGIVGVKLEKAATFMDSLGQAIDRALMDTP